MKFNLTVARSVALLMALGILEARAEMPQPIFVTADMTVGTFLENWRSAETGQHGELNSLLEVTNYLGYVGGLMSGFAVANGVMERQAQLPPRSIPPCIGASVTPEGAIAALKVATEQGFVKPDISLRTGLFGALYRLYPCKQHEAGNLK